MFDMTAAFISPPPLYCSSGFTDMRKWVENNIIHYYLGTVIGLSKMPPKKALLLPFLVRSGGRLLSQIIQCKVTVWIIVLNP